MVTRPARAVRVPILCRKGIPEPLEARRARLEAVTALSRYLSRLGMEATAPGPIFDYSVDEHGTWWCTATVQTVSQTWRTHRTRRFSPCTRCGRRGNGVSVTDDGARCRDHAACLRAAARRRTCDECGRLGTPYNITVTEAGTHLCKAGCAIAPVEVGSVPVPV